MTQEAITKEIERAKWSVNYHKKELVKAEILLDGLSRKIATE